jgi:hypothetical protein
MMQMTNDGGVFKKLKKNQYLMMMFITNYNWMDNALDVYECLYMKIIMQKSLYWKEGQW